MKKISFLSILATGTILAATPAIAQDSEATSPDTMTVQEHDMAGHDMSGDTMTDQTMTDQTMAEDTMAQPAVPAQEVSRDDQQAAVTAATEAEAAQEAGNHSEAAAKFAAAIPTLKKMEANMQDAQMTAYLATTMAKAANSQIALNNNPATIAIYDESIPVWKKVYMSDTSNPDTRDLLLNYMTTVGIQKMVDGDNDAAMPYFQDVLNISTEAAMTSPDDAALANAMLTAHINLYRISDDQIHLDKAKTLSAELKTKGMVNERNQEVVATLTADS